MKQSTSLLYIPLGWQELGDTAHPELFQAFAKNGFSVIHMNRYLCTDYYYNKGVFDNPQLIYIQSGAIHHQKLRKIKENTGAKIIQWTGDCRAETMFNVTQYKGIVDLTLLAVGIGQKEMYEQELGSPVDYLQQGALKSFFLTPKTNYTNGKTIFIGNNYDHFEGAIERTDLCRRLSFMLPDEFEVIGNGFNLPQFNNTRSVHYSESPQLYNNAFISISHACFNEIEGYYSNRTIDILAAGGCCIMRRTPNIEKWFTDMEHLVLYDNNNEAVDKINWLYANPNQRNEIALRGYNLACKFHTFDWRVKEIKGLLKKHKI